MSMVESSTDPAPAPHRLEPMALLEHVPLTAYLLRVEDGDFVLEGVNAAARAKTPALSSMLGRRISQLYADQPQIIADAWRCHREQTRVLRETSVRRHERVDGVRQTLVFAWLDPQHIVIYAQEDGDRENASAELNELGERYKSLVASLPEAMLLRGQDGRVLACNDAAARLFGHAQATDLWGRVEVLPSGWRLETSAAEPVAPEAAPSRRSAQSGEAVRGELLKLMAPGGELRWLRVSAQPIRKSDGTLGGSVTLFSDETESVLARQAERESAVQLQMALDAGRMGTWQYDPTRDEGAWSPSLNDTFRKGAAPNFQAYLERVHPDDRETLRRGLQDLLTRESGAAFENEHRLIGDDGVTRWVRASGRVERTRQGVRMRGTAMDVTERRRMQDELVRASRLESLGRLAGGLAHDFNNLLAAMLGSVELLGDVCPPEGQEDLQTLRHVTLRARDLTAQLLAFARKQRVELETIELGALIGKVERLLRRLVGPRVELVLDSRAAGEGLYVLADAAQLEQVLVNLVVNARDAMPEGGRINVRLALEQTAGAAQEWVLLEVRDQGRGIDKEHLAHVFDPFFTTKESGTGLGLASSYGVVQAHGGSISVDSDPGRGASFKVRLPRVTPRSAPELERQASRPGHGHVLLVDDDDNVRGSTARMLQSLGYQVLVAGSGSEAEALAREHVGPLELLVCDLAMPEHSGLEVAARLRSIYPDIKALFVSGYPGGAERELAAETFLQKPFDREALARKLNALSSAASVPARRA